VPKILALDTETSGVDFGHGARPFVVTTCDENNEQRTWAWSVDPKTREVDAPNDEIETILDLIASADELVLQNAKFDATALNALDPRFGEEWPWHKTHDTLIAAHLLHSNQPKNLTALGIRWLGYDATPFEDALEKAVKRARQIVRTKAFVTKHGKWDIASEDNPKTPSAGEDTWRFDYWLPKAVAEAEGYGPDHEHENWYTVLEEYARSDTAVTLNVHRRMQREIRDRGREKLYRERLRLLGITWRMERRGVTESGESHDALVEQFTEESAKAGRICVNIAAQYRTTCPDCTVETLFCPTCQRDREVPYNLTLPKNGVNNSLRSFCFDVMRLEQLRSPKSKTSAPTLDAKVAMPHYLATLPVGSRELTFIKNLLGKRARDTALSYLESYAKFRLPVMEMFDGDDQAHQGKFPEEGEPERPNLSPQENEVLVMDGREGPGRVRGVLRERTTDSPPSGVRPVRGRNPNGDVDLTSLRQPAVCEPGTPVPRNAPRQQQRHGIKGETSERRQKRVAPTPTHQAEGQRPRLGQESTVSREGRGSAAGEDDRRRCEEAQKHVRDGKVEAERPRPSLRDRTINRRGDSPQKDVGTRDLRRWYKLHPSYSICGSDTLRFTCRNPNTQQISKKDDVNLRKAFGFLPGREGWSLDAKNIELRIPFYKCGQQELIDLFECPNDPPYYGSNHLLNFHTVYPDIWAEVEREVGVEKAGPTCKKRFASTWYQWCKNGGFAIQYNAGRRTADLAFHRDGSFDRLKSRFNRLEALNRQQIAFANKYGYVETIPDRSVDPDRGYPLVCTRTEQGRILETVPLSYYVQGTAMWWTARAMVRAQEQLDYWRRTDGFDGHICLQVHDELVLDFPKAANPKTDPANSNLWRIRVIQELMSLGGEDIGIPTPVGAEWHESNWGEGVTL